MGGKQDDSRDSQPGRGERSGPGVGWRRRPLLGRGAGADEARGRDGEHRHLHRAADRRAAAAARARLREADRRQGAVDHRAVLGPLQQAADRFRHRHQQLRRRGVRAAVDGRLHRARLPRGADRPGQGRHGAASGTTSRPSSATSAPATRARSTPSRSMATSRWSTTGPTCSRRPVCSRPRPGTTISQIAQTLQRQGPERRRQARLRLVHRQEAQRPVLLVHHLGRRQLPADPGHRPGRLLRHRRR